MLEKLKKVTSKLKRTFEESTLEKKLEYIFDILWLLLLGCYVLLTGIITVFLQFMAHLFVIAAGSMVWFAVYAVLHEWIVERREKQEHKEERQNNSKKVEFAEKYRPSSEFQNTEDDSVNGYEVENAEGMLFGREPKISVYNNWRVCKNEEESYEQSPYYLLETSMLFAMQQYAKRFGCAVGDIVHGNMPLTDCYEQLSEVIKKGRCYVPSDVYDEVVALEEKKQLDSGTAIFIQEDMGIWPNVSSEFSFEDFCIIFGKCKERHYKILLIAVEISQKRDSKVWIVTTSKKLASLVNAYVATFDAEIGVVNPSELEEEI